MYIIYLSLFPEGSAIRHQFVGQLWVSEGFVETAAILKRLHLSITGMKKSSATWNWKPWNCVHLVSRADPNYRASRVHWVFSETYSSWVGCSLPKGIGKLQSLWILDLWGTSLHQVLPTLENLKLLSVLHGFIVNCMTKCISGWPLEDLISLNALTSLRILKMERVSDCLRMQKAPP